MLAAFSSTLQAVFEARDRETESLNDSVFFWLFNLRGSFLCGGNFISGEGVFNRFWRLVLDFMAPGMLCVAH